MKIHIPAGTYALEQEQPDGTYRLWLEQLPEGDVELDVDSVPLKNAETFARRLWLNRNGLPPEHFEPMVRMRDLTLIHICAKKLAERGHRWAANSLRKMAREGKIP